jgi:hypothetical protein
VSTAFAWVPAASSAGTGTCTLSATPATFNAKFAVVDAPMRTTTDCLALSRAAASTITSKAPSGSSDTA